MTDEAREDPDLRWARVRSLFEAAVDRDASERIDWLANETVDDPSIGAEVRSLLDHHTRAGQFLSRPLLDDAPDLLGGGDPLVPGAVVGQYRIIRELGRGGMGQVYLATDTKLARVVALKALAPDLVRDPLQRERLRREARAAGALQHPGICTVYALEELDGEVYISTEFVDGQTLSDEIRSGRRPTPEDLLQTGRELAAALASAHAAGIVHRDLKPDNVMRGRDGRLKILDFGLARPTGPTHLSQLGDPAATFRTAPGTIVGTPAYMAPEQINGQPADARADVFALGVVLYEYACGVHPFAAGTPIATAARVLEGNVRPIEARCPEIGSALAKVISRCLCKIPEGRFATAGELLAAFEIAGDGGTSGASEALHAPLWWRTHQIVVVMLYAVAATLTWQVKEWKETPVTLAIFIGLSAGATVGGVLRGHLVFTEQMNPRGLRAERRRTAGVIRLTDLLIAGLLIVDGAIVATFRALPGVLSVSLALGIALAAVVLEPATTTAAFGELDASSSSGSGS